MSVQVVELVSVEDRESYARFRYRVLHGQAGQDLPGMDHQAGTFPIPLDEDSRMLVAVDQESGATVGCLQALIVGEEQVDSAVVQPLNLGGLIGSLGHDRVSVSGALLVEPAYRGRTVASLLVTHLYQLQLERGILVDICASPFSMAPLYQQLGYRPYAPAFRDPDEGYRLPQLLTLCDAKHFLSVRSPFRRFLAIPCDDGGETAKTVEGLYQHFFTPEVNPRTLRALWAGLAHGDQDDPGATLLAGLEESQIEDLVGPWPEVEVKRNETIYDIGEMEHGMGLLVQGEMGVTLQSGDNPHILSVLEAGQIFGEMSSALGVGRTARVVALTDSRVLLLPEDALDELDTKNPELATKLRKNIVRSLCGRLDAMNQLVGGSRTPEMNPATTVNAIAVGTESDVEYSLDDLVNPAKAPERQERQARATEIEELHWLQRSGLSGARILEVGSGSGHHGLVLAALSPTSTIIGVGSTAEQVKEAQTRSSEADLTSRCVFEEGSADALPQEENSVGASMARFVLRDLPDPAAALAEMVRVTRPGGSVAVLDIDEATLLIHPEIAGLQDFLNRAGSRRRKSGLPFHLGRSLHALLEAAGLEQVQVELIPLHSHRLAPQVLWELGLATSLESSSGVEDLDATDRTLLDSLLATRDQPSTWCALTVFLAQGRVPAKT